MIRSMASAAEVDDALAAGTVQLVLGSDFEGVGVPTAPQPAPDEVTGVDQRTAGDQSCIR